MEIEYVDKSHTYLLDGVEIPSVSTLCRYALGDPYPNVPRHILDRASAYGTKVHEYIEKEPLYISEEYREALETWHAIRDEHGIEILSTEEIVFTEDYAGRYDMIANVDGVRSLIDVKTNAVLPEKHLRFQMALYRYAMKEDDLPCWVLWLPKKGKGGLYRVEPYPKAVTDALIEAYAQNKPFIFNETPRNVQIYTKRQIAKLRRFYALKQEVEEIERNGKKKALEIMKKNGIKSFENESLRITYTAPTVRKAVDVNALKADGLYERYAKETEVAEGVRITWKE